jgi:hypothetical protein
MSCGDNVSSGLAAAMVSIGRNGARKLDQSSLGESLLIARVLLVVFAILAAAVRTLTLRKRDVLRGNYVGESEHYEP